MSSAEIYCCDVCGRSKGETNHWYELLETTGIAGETFYRRLIISAFRGSKFSEHICSSKCLAERVVRFEEHLRDGDYA